MVSRSVLLLLLALACLDYLAAAQSAKGPEDCCFNFFRKPIPVMAIKKYENTSDDCPRAGFIFTTHKSRRVCVDPSFKWVQRAMEEVDKRLFVESST